MAFSLFDRMKSAVTRTRESLSSSLSSVVALTREVDDASLDDLELALLASDIGSNTTNEIIARLRDRALRQGINDGAELKTLLKAEILRILNAVDKPAARPAAPEVIMMVGVNGTGKTTTGRAAVSCSAPPTPSAPPPSSSSKSGRSAPA
jgi:fused signal recognition particle receptor